jgi:hypothetical protein
VREEQRPAAGDVGPKLEKSACEQGACRSSAKTKPNQASCRAGHRRALPLPRGTADDGTCTPNLHAWFEVAVGREPMPREPQVFRALIEKYAAHKESDQCRSA